jgi:hypothetical protein
MRNVEIVTDNSWLLSETWAPAVRFMQDQPMCTGFDLHRAASFATRVAASFEVTGLSGKQLEALNNTIAGRHWKEPPRWKPYAEVIPNHHFFVSHLNEWVTGDYYQIWLCPGAVDQAAFNDLRAARPDGMHAGATIGRLYEYTNNVDDPRVDRTPSEKRQGKRAYYTTVCRRLVNAARQRGLLVE